MCKRFHPVIDHDGGDIEYRLIWGAQNNIENVFKFKMWKISWRWQITNSITWPLSTIFFIYCITQTLNVTGSWTKIFTNAIHIFTNVFFRWNYLLLVLKLIVTFICLHIKYYLCDYFLKCNQTTPTSSHIWFTHTIEKNYISLCL